MVWCGVQYAVCSVLCAVAWCVVSGVVWLGGEVRRGDERRGEEVSSLKRRTFTIGIHGVRKKRLLVKISDSLSR